MVFSSAGSLVFEALWPPAGSAISESLDRSVDPSNVGFVATSTTLSVSYLPREGGSDCAAVEVVGVGPVDLHRHDVAGAQRAARLDVHRTVDLRRVIFRAAL